MGVLRQTRREVIIIVIIISVIIIDVIARKWVYFHTSKTDRY